MSRLRQELAGLYEEVGQQLFHCALSVTVSGDLAEDAVHDAFTKAFCLQSNPKNLRAYMFRAVRNSAVDIVRRQWRIVQPTTYDIFEVAKEFCHGSTHECELDTIVSGLVTLSDDERETVVEHLVAGLTMREIAELRGRPIGTISTWYRRGLEKLRKKLRQYDE